MLGKVSPEPSLLFSFGRSSYFHHLEAKSGEWVVLDQDSVEGKSRVHVSPTTDKEGIILSAMTTAGNEFNKRPLLRGHKLKGSLVFRSNQLLLLLLGSADYEPSSLAFRLSRSPPLFHSYSHTARSWREARLSPACGLVRLRRTQEPLRGDNNLFP